MCYSAMVKRELKILEKKFGSISIRDDLEDFDFDTRKDVRIFPGTLAPVVFFHGGKLTAEPMIYSCFQPEHFAGRQYTSFNARRDNLTSSFWNDAFLHHHGCVVLGGFSEWVEVKLLLKAGVVTLDEVKKEFEHQIEVRRAKLAAQGKPYKATKTELTDSRFRKIIIEFRASADTELFVPIIFNERAGKKGFAIVTDDPLPEVESAGHDRSPVFLTLDAIEEWMTPQGKTARQMDAVLAKKWLPKFTHDLMKSA